MNQLPASQMAADQEFSAKASLHALSEIVPMIVVKIQATWSREGNIVYILLLRSPSPLVLPHTLSRIKVGLV